MKLSIIDRLIITKSLLPETGTIDRIKLMISIKNKLCFSNEELESFKIFEPYKGVLEIPNVTSDMLERNLEYDISIQEIEILKEFAKSVDANGWVTESSLNTIEYIINYTLENDKE